MGADFQTLSHKAIIVSLTVCAFLMPVLITPWFSFDPITLPRLALLTCLTIFQWPFIFKHIPDIYLKKSLLDLISNPATWSIIFILVSLIATFKSSKSFLLQFMGTDSRNAGLLFFILLMTLVISVLLFSNKKFQLLFLYSFGIGGAINLAYGLIQCFDDDPIFWNNPYGPVIGTLGNPNFMSSYLGLFGVLIFALLVLLKKWSVFQKLGLVFVLLLVVYTILETRSIQGLVVVLVGLILTLTKRLLPKIDKSQLFFVSLISLASFAIAIIGFFGKGPFGGLLFQSTIKVRSYYWNAAVNMINASPLFGHGFDSFGDLYPQYRGQNATLDYGPGLVSDSAHNLLLDIGVSGGIPLMICYLLLQFIILIKGLKSILSKNKSSEISQIYFILWICFQAQTLISPSQILITYTGFILGALVLKGDSAKIVLQQSKFSSSSNIGRVVLTPITILFLLGSVIFSFRVISADSNFRLALVNGEGNGLKLSSAIWPLSERRLIITSRIFYANDYNDIGRELSLKILKLNPRSLEALRLLAQDSNLSSVDRNRFLNQIRELDPFGKEATEVNQNNN
jgi:O-antigen ligase